MRGNLQHSNFERHKNIAKENIQIRSQLLYTFVYFISRILYIYSTIYITYIYIYYVHILGTYIRHIYKVHTYPYIFFIAFILSLLQIKCSHFTFWHFFGSNICLKHLLCCIPCIQNRTISSI